MHSHRLPCAVAVCALLLLGGCAAPTVRPPAGVDGVEGVAGAAGPAAADEEEADAGPGAGHVALLYLPNRLFDLLDIVRARLRLGPGLAFGARATEFADVYLGTYGTVWVGLPGPREERSINWPVGLETKSGAELSLADASVEGGVNYGWLEVGLGGQLLIIGADVGVDVWEAVDFLTGLVTVDPVGDDL